MAARCNRHRAGGAVMRAMRAILTAAAIAIACAPVAAEQRAGVPAAPRAAAAQGPLLPQPVAILAMVRSTLVAVDQGNKTGNYTVLRDLAGPDFHDANDASKLAQIFGSLTAQQIDLLAVAVVEPEYKSPPAITQANMLYVAGRFPIVPKPVNFELLYQMHQGRWRIFGIAIRPAG